MYSVPGGAHWGGGLFINTLDLARAGYLMLRRGNWNGQQLISEDWIDQSLTACQLNPGYGYMWWLNTGNQMFGSASEKAFAAMGAGGNIVFMDPKYDLVIVTRWTKNHGNVIDRIVRSLNKALIPLGLGAGLTLFVRYLRNIRLLSYIEQLFGPLRKSGKGQTITEIFKQVFCFLMDGTSRHLVYFDTLKNDEGYAQTIETDKAHMLSSHSVKRFYQSLLLHWTHWFRKVLLRLFSWRLQIMKPEVVVLGIDTMVMDNDEATIREGVQPTYKKEKGFQPLQMTWRRFIVDAIFRSGDKHSNHGTDVEKMVRRMVAFIRKEYRQEVPIIIRLDSGFFDQKLFQVFESLKIGYICGGKLYQDINERVAQMDRSSWGSYKNGDQVWEYVEFMDQRDSWDQSRRAIFCRPFYKDRQMVLSFARPETIIYTNLGMGTELDRGLVKAEMRKVTTTRGIIEAYHDRGGDELVNRALKDFGSEQLPFKRFHQNAAFYFTMLIGFFLYEAFKEDVCTPVVAVSSYATTLRRKIIDVAGKIVRHAEKTTLKITRAAWNALDFYHLWIKSENPPPIGQT